MIKPMETIINAHNRTTINSGWIRLLEVKKDINKELKLKNHFFH
jgi:hypothetical protein